MGSATEITGADASAAPLNDAHHSARPFTTKSLPTGARAVSISPDSKSRHGDQSCQLRWRNPSPRGLPYGFSAARVSGVGIGDTCGSFSVPVMLKPGTPSRVSFRFKTRVRDAVPLT